MTKYNIMNNKKSNEFSELASITINEIHILGWETIFIENAYFLYKFINPNILDLN